MALQLAHKYKRPPTVQELVSTSLKDAKAYVQDLITAIKSGRWHPFSPIERKAREATRNEPWGPTGTLLNELAEASFDATNLAIIFATLEFRLGYPPDKWRNVYKALTVLEFLLKRGAEPAVRLAREDLMLKLEDLTSFEYVTHEGRDMGVNVRHRAQAIHALLKDERRLSEERALFASKRNAYKGYSRNELEHVRASPGGVSPDARHALSEGQLPAHIGYGWSPSRSYAREQGSSGTPDATPTSRFREVDSCDAASPSTPATGGRGAEYLEHTPSASAMRRAGETKGVSMEENKAYLSVLKALLARPENRACADCGEASAGSRPSWASISIGVFICMRCAGIHRGLGVHISKVRSCTLDTWLPHQVEFMAAIGNGAANAHWEARLPADVKGAARNLAELEAFIRRKYVSREYVSDAAEPWPPAIDEQVAAMVWAEVGMERGAVPGSAMRSGSIGAGLQSQRSRARSSRDVDGAATAGAHATSGPTVRMPPPPEPLALDLIDFGDGDASGIPTSGTTPASAPPRMNSRGGGFGALEEVFSAPNLMDLDWSGTSAPAVELSSMSTPNLRSWDMGAAFESMSIAPPGPSLERTSAPVMPSGSPHALDSRSSQPRAACNETRPQSAHDAFNAGFEGFGPVQSVKVQSQGFESVLVPGRVTLPPPAAAAPVQSPPVNAASAAAQLRSWAPTPVPASFPGQATPVASSSYAASYVQPSASTSQTLLPPSWQNGTNGGVGGAGFTNAVRSNGATNAAAGRGPSQGGQAPPSSPPPFNGAPPSNGGLVLNEHEQKLRRLLMQGLEGITAEPRKQAAGTPTPWQGAPTPYRPPMSSMRPMASMKALSPQRSQASVSQAVQS